MYQRKRSLAQFSPEVVQKIRAADFSRGRRADGSCFERGYLRSISSASCNLKDSFDSGLIVMSRSPVRAAPAVPAPAPAPAPMAAPLPPPAIAPISAPTTAPPPAPSAVRFPRFLPDSVTSVVVTR